MILADTSILIRGSGLDEDGTLAVSIVSLGELQVGVLLAADAPMRNRRLSRLALISQTARLLPVDSRVADAYAALRASVGRQPTNDLWIAATAIAHGLELVTGDEAQAKLPGLTARYVAD